METVEIADLYQASYLLMNGCRLEGIRCVLDAGSVTCKMSFSGSNLQPLVMSWFEKKAVVNLWAFRGAYGQICDQVMATRRAYRTSAKALPQASLEAQP
jgi:hypothetical protein